MFNKLKQIKDLRQQAKTIQSALAEETITCAKHGVSVSLNGNLEVTALHISDEAKDKLDDKVKACLNEAIHQAQTAMAKKMQSMGNLPKISELLK